MKCIRMLTFIPIEEIEEIENWDAGRINEKKELLAFHLTSLVHGEDEANKAKETAKALFSGEGDDANMPTTVIAEDKLTDGVIGVLDLLCACGLTASKGEARRLVEQGGVSIDGEKVAATNATVTKEQLENSIKIKKGKKVFHKATL